MNQKYFIPPSFNMIPKPLPCGCIVGIFDCAELQRIDSIKNDAFHRGDLREYEKYRKLSWKHIGMKAPKF